MALVSATVRLLAVRGSVAAYKVPSTQAGARSGTAL
jgi:hypothetical protein